MNKTCGTIIVGIVYVLIATIAYSFNRYVLYAESNTAGGALGFLFFNVIVAFIYIAHWNCMCADPGFVPPGWGAELKQESADLEAPSSSKACYCAKCRNERPERAHHCKSCGKCVVNMDHHCPWMNNCVGLHNRKLFVVFLFYAVLGCGIVAFGMLSTFFNEINHTEGSKSAFVIGIYLVDVILVLAIGGLFFFQLKMVYLNQTTLEVLAQSDAVYDRGWLENYRLVFGPDPWFWVLPWQLGAPRNSPITNGQESSSLFLSLIHI
eukprot:TRINITY_DN1369_c0_g1_i4.p1 TRINITY_DN1369_c0_g1~~TRINITY_DN1369_c0_g1_i4.p1  ORF type:complete len:265 (+),score=43.38 TRINITY_DN1369_c0_g1_i4:52-846(+)